MTNANGRSILASVSRGETTKQTILEHAIARASEVGLSGLSIGNLAQELSLSKSGLFAHFKSKDALEVAVLEFAAQRFVDVVLRPALATPRGEPRIRALFESWMHWPKRSGLPGGCVFMSASAELDDKPGPARDRLVAFERDFLDLTANMVSAAIKEGHFHEGVDPAQFAFEFYGIMVSGHRSYRLLRDPEATARTRRAFEDLVLRSRRTS